MRYRTLGCTGLRVSVVGIGTWQLGGEWGGPFSQEQADEILISARECGINLIDTAECYGDHESERLIGGAIASGRAGRRGDWVIASKFGHKFHGHLNRTEPRTPADVIEQTEASLAALRTDYIDVHQYHSWGDDQFFTDDVLSVLLKLRDQGKIRHIGNSIGKNVNVRQVAASASRHISVIQLVYNRLDRGPETTTLPLCAAQNLGVLARVPLASGWLSGKYEPGHVFPAADVRSRQKSPAADEAKLRELEVAKTEVPAGLNMATWALAWCLKHPAVTAVIPGCRNAEQVRQNAAAGDIEL